MKILSIVILTLLSLSTFAQLDSLGMAEKVEHVDLVFGGQIIADSSYFSSNHATIFSIKYIKVLKKFKGNFPSDTIKVIVEETESHVGDYHMKTYDGGYFVLPVGLQGVFFCVPVKNDKYYQVYTDNIYKIKLNCYGLIQFKSEPGNKRYWINNCLDTYYLNDIEKDLFTTLENIAGKLAEQNGEEKK